MKRIHRRDWFVQAPIVICACGPPAHAWQHKSGKNCADVDVAIVMDYLILAATDLGLGTCWVAAFDHQAAREILGLPEGVEPIAFTPLSHPADQPKSRTAKDPDGTGALRAMVTQRLPQKRTAMGGRTMGFPAVHDPLGQVMIRLWMKSARRPVTL